VSPYGAPNNQKSARMTLMQHPRGGIAMQHREAGRLELSAIGACTVVDCAMVLLSALPAVLLRAREISSRAPKAPRSWSQNH
jgi:hypothetical protein